MRLWKRKRRLEVISGALALLANLIGVREDLTSEPWLTPAPAIVQADKSVWSDWDRQENTYKVVNLFGDTVIAVTGIPGRPAWK